VGTCVVFSVGLFVGLFWTRQIGTRNDKTWQVAAKESLAKRFEYTKCWVSLAL
jgi:hypothetical protein